jgi:hypothetical protein
VTGRRRAVAMVATLLASGTAGCNRRAPANDPTPQAERPADPCRRHPACPVPRATPDQICQFCDRTRLPCVVWQGENSCEVVHGCADRRFVQNGRMVPGIANIACPPERQLFPVAGERPVDRDLVQAAYRCAVRTVPGCRELSSVLVTDASPTRGFVLRRVEGNDETVGGDGKRAKLMSLADLRAAAESTAVVDFLHLEVAAVAGAKAGEAYEFTATTRGLGRDVITTRLCGTARFSVRKRGGTWSCDSVRHSAGGRSSE